MDMPPGIRDMSEDTGHELGGIDLLGDLAVLLPAQHLESSLTLMRLCELEALEKVSEKANLNVGLGEKGLADRVVKLL
jgi:hypothetical protein